MNWRVKKIGNFRTGSKYKNVSQTYNGYSYGSKLEAKTAQELDFRVNAGELESWERQVKIELFAYGDRICNYYIDFVAKRPDGILEYIECKGIEFPLWKLKWKIFMAQYKEQIEKGEIEVTVIR